MGQQGGAPPIIDIIAGRGDWRNILERDYTFVARRLTASYGRMLRTLRPMARDLLTEMRRIEATGARATAQQIRDLAQYRDLINRIELEMGEFAALARDGAGDLQQLALPLGTNVAEGQVLLQAGDAAAELVAGAYIRPDPAALETLINYVDSDAMRAKFRQFGANAAQNFADGMLSLVAQGKHPVAIARYMNKWWGVPLSWAENMTRTTQIWSYRAAAHSSYAANGRLLDGWMWRAALDVRTCLSCLSRHHRGRCAAVPVLKGSTWTANVESGRDWYGRLPTAVQRRMAGDTMFTALNQGDVSFDDLSKIYQDDVFGEMLREASVRELIADNRRYARLRVDAAMMPRNRITNERAAVLAAQTRVNR
jgi:hypothetical protein